MIKALVAGAGGRMGGRIIAALDDQEGITLAGAFERRGHAALGQDAGEPMPAALPINWPPCAAPP